MTTPGNPLSLLNSKIKCPKCGNDNWNIRLESACPQCGFKHQLTKSIKGTLGERFDIIEDPKRGGMGEVFICEPHEEPDFKIAFKTFQKRLFFDKISQDAFIREIINWMRVTGIPHIMPAVYLEYFDGRPFIGMPAIESDSQERSTLRDFISHGHLSADEILKYAFQIAIGMHLIQYKLPGLIHGDLKPENIFLCNDEVFISDFGLSRIVHDSYEDFELESTYAYQAPECWTKAIQPSPSIDVYSFGIILYELIIGNPPFNASTREGWKNAHLNSTPEIPRGFEKNGLLRRFLELSLNCLKKNPSDRPKDFEDILKQVETIGYDDDPSLQLYHLYKTINWTTSFESVQGICTKNLITTLFKLDKIELALEELDNIDPSIYDAKLWAMRGNVLSLQNRDEEAINCFETALKYELPEEEEFVYIIDYGLSLKRLERFDEAIKLYGDLLMKVPDSLLPRLVTNFATVYIRSGKSSNAIDLLKPFLIKNPQNAQGWGNLGIAYADQKQFDQAILSFERALAVAPELAEVRLQLARVLMDDLFRLKDAITSLELAYGQGYAPFELCGRLIQCYLNEERFGDAKRLLEEMQRNFSDDIRTNRITSEYYRATGDFEKALEEINSAISEAPHDAELYFTKSIIFYSTGNIEEEIKCLKKVLEFNPMDGEAAANLTVSLLELKRSEEAKKFGRIAQECGTLGQDIEEELGWIRSSEPKIESSGQDEVNEIECLTHRLSLYLQNCQAFEDSEKQALYLPVKIDIEKNFSACEIFEIIKMQWKEVDVCPLPILVTGIRFCHAGRFDLASLIWEEALKKWPFMPDFPFGLGFIFEQMLQPEKANKFFELASKNGLDRNINIRRGAETVMKSLPCCSKIQNREERL